MNKDAHLMIAALIGYSIVEVLNIFWSNYILGFNARFLIIISSMFGAILPDKLEKPKSWSHRKFFHSKTWGAAVLFTGFAFSNNPYVVAFCSGYLSHLLLDYTTRKKLPLL